jgi:hypothetical protein
MNTVTDTFYSSKLKTYFVLILVPVLLYFKSFFYDFSPMDEQWLIIRKQPFLADLGNLTHSFKDSIQNIYYRPFFICSLILDYQFDKLNPFMFHITNVLLHVLCTVSLLKFLKLLTIPVQTAFFFTILFSVHPVLLHTVTWVPGRNDSMLCLFTLLSLIYLIKYLNTKKVILLISHLAFFIFALLTKENAILLPLVFAALIFIFSKFSKKTIGIALLWLGLALAWLMVRNNIISFFPSSSESNYLIVFKNLFLAFLIFIGKSLFPFSQSISPTLSNSMPSILLGIVSLSLLLFAYFKLGVKNKKLAFFGLFLFFILLVLPAWYGALATNGIQYEHRLYAPLIGIIIFISQLNFKFSSPNFKYIILTLALIFSFKTYMRMSVYQNQSTFLAEGIKECPDNYFFLFQSGVIEANKKNYNEAISYFDMALKLRPNEEEILQQRGSAFMGIAQYEKAVLDFNDGLKLSANNPNFLLPRCICYLRLDKIELAMIDLQTLKQCCQNFIPPQLHLEEEITYKWRALSLKNINNLIEKSPDSGILYVNRAKMYLNMRMGKEALADLKKACELEPNNAGFKGYFNELNNSLPH